MSEAALHCQQVQTELGVGALLRPFVTCLVHGWTQSPQPSLGFRSSRRKCPVLFCCGLQEAACFCMLACQSVSEGCRCHFVSSDDPGASPVEAGVRTLQRGTPLLYLVYAIWRERRQLPRSEFVML